MRARSLVLSIRLGPVGADSVTPTVYGLIERGVALRPELAASMRFTVVIRFHEAYAPVRIAFGGSEHGIEVGDAIDAERAYDLEISGRLPDIVALISAPLLGGLPKPTSPRGRAALARLADGRVEFDGPLRHARRLVALLSVDG